MDLFPRSAVACTPPETEFMLVTSSSCTQEISPVTALIR